MSSNPRSPSSSRRRRATSAAVAAVLGTGLLLGCDPVGGEPPGGAVAAVPGPPRVEESPVPDGVVYVMGAARLGAVVVVVESTDAPLPVEGVLATALQRPAGDSLLGDLDPARFPGGLHPRRTSLYPDPLTRCVSVNPSSGASTFRGVRYATAGGPRAAINRFVLRYDSEDRAVEQLERFRNQLDSCPVAAADVREERGAAPGMDDAFVVRFLVPEGVERQVQGT
jgi:hypothetical protein